jgi:hypothetical protein
MNRGLKGIQEPLGKLVIELRPELRKSRARNPSARKPPARKFPSHRVFLCYRRRDGAFVSLIRNMLIQKGLPVWMDRSHIKPGRRWRKEIEEAIAQSRVVLIFVGPSGLGPFQEWEVNRAMDLELNRLLYVIPVILPQVEETKIPSLLRDLQFVDYRGEQDPSEELVEAIEDYLEE